MSRILVVDDDPEVRLAVEIILRRQGHEVAVAGDGREGLKKFNAHDYDLVVTDMLMPELDGIEMIQAIRHTNLATKILAMSGAKVMGNTELLGMAAVLGADKILKKPFSPDQLIDSVNSAVAS